MEANVRWRRGLIGTVAASVVAFAGAPGPVGAQVQVGPAKVHRSVMEVPKDDKGLPRLSLKELDGAYREGNWGKAESKALELLRALAEQDTSLAKERCKAGIAPSCQGDHLGTHLDVSALPVNLLWRTTGKDGKPTIAQLLVAAGIRPEHVKELPGLSGDERPLRDVFVHEFKGETSDKDPTRFFSWYTSTPRASVTAGQLPDFIAKLPLFGFIAKAAPGAFRTLGSGNADLRDDVPAKKDWIAVTVNIFELPDDSADLASQYALWSPKTGDQLITATGKTAASVRLREALWSPCGQSVVGSIETALVAAMERPMCRTPAVPAEERCVDPTADDGLYALAEANAACAETLQTAVGTAYEQAVTRNPECKDQKPAEAAAIVAIEKRFAEFGEGATPIRHETALTNVPYVRHSFGLMTGVGIGQSRLGEATPRVKLDGGKIVEDPLDRQLTTAIVNFHPVPYRGTTRKMTGGERLRLFAGAVLTPDFGFTAGGGFGLVRGLAVNVGGVYLLSDTLRPEDSLAAAPTNRRNPFKTKGHFMPIIGLSYVFK